MTEQSKSAPRTKIQNLKSEGSAQRDGAGGPGDQVTPLSWEQRNQLTPGVAKLLLELTDM